MRGPGRPRGCDDAAPRFLVAGHRLDHEQCGTGWAASWQRPAELHQQHAQPRRPAGWGGTQPGMDSLIVASRLRMVDVAQSSYNGGLYLGDFDECLMVVLAIEVDSGDSEEEWLITMFNDMK